MPNQKTSKPNLIKKIGRDWYILNDIREELKKLNLEKKWEETNKIITIWQDPTGVVYIPCRDWHIFCHNNGVEYKYVHRMKFNNNL